MGAETNFSTKSILCLPIMDPTKHERLFGVTQLLNKRDKSSGSVVEFTDSDKQKFQSYLTFVGIAMSNLAKLQRRRSQMYDAVNMYSQCLLEEKTSSSEILRACVEHLGLLLNADRITAYID